MRIKALLASALAVLSLGITSCDNEEEKVLEIEGVVINVSSAELTIGDTLVISAIVQPYGLDPASIQWEDDKEDYVFWRSDDPNVATVDQNGMVIATGRGTCTIRLVCGTFSAGCHITVRHFDTEMLFGQWQASAGSSFYFHYDGTGKVGNESMTWTFDGMRLAVTSGSVSNTYIMVSAEPCKFTWYNLTDATKQPETLNMAARTITNNDLRQGVVQVEGKDGVMYDAVDMGLSSGILWSTCNLMAESPEQTGNFFAWGETEPKRSFLLDNYKWYDNSAQELTKYINGDESREITLEISDDAANAIMGGTWRIPTNDEILELCSNCYTVWSKLDGIDGIQFVSKQENCKGNSIFMPMSGLAENYYQQIAGNDMLIGIYWSSTLSRGYDFDAYYLQLTNKPESELNKCYYASITTRRNGGACIRPVAGR